MNQDLSDAQKFQNLKIINLAMMAGATMFLMICGFIIYKSSGKTPANEGNFMTFALLVAATWGVSQMLKLQIEMLFRKKLAGENPFNAYQTQLILRMALSEGPALFGLVGLFIFGPGADLSASPGLLIFLLPYLILIATGLRHRPSEEDFRDRVRVAKENAAFRR